MLLKCLRRTSGWVRGWRRGTGLENVCVLQEAGTKSVSKTCATKSVCVGGWGRGGGLAHVRQTQRTRSPRPGWLWRRPSGSRSYANPARHTQVSVTPQTTLSHMVTPGPSEALGPARRGRLAARPLASGRGVPGCPAPRAGPRGPLRAARAWRTGILLFRGRSSPSRLSPRRVHSLELWRPRHFCSHVSDFLIFETIPGVISPRCERRTDVAGAAGRDQELGRERHTPRTAHRHRHRPSALGPPAPPARGQRPRRVGVPFSTGTDRASPPIPKSHPRSGPASCLLSVSLRSGEAEGAPGVPGESASHRCFHRPGRAG